MRGTISKIHPIKRSRNGNSFVRVEFRLENGSWAKTDICPDFRNFSRWKDILKLGIDLTGLVLKNTTEVDADSYPIIFKEKLNQRWVQLPDGTMELVTEAVKIEELKPEEKTLYQDKLI